jgi:hypothetical protein
MICHKQTKGTIRKEYSALVRKIKDVILHCHKKLTLIYIDKVEDRKLKYIVFKNGVLFKKNRSNFNKKLSHILARTKLKTFLTSHISVKE